LNVDLAHAVAAIAGVALIGASLAAPPAVATAPTAIALTEHGAANSNCLTQELVHNVHGGGTLALWAAPDGHVKAALVDADGLASDVVNVTTDDTKVASWSTCQQVAAAPNPTGGWLVVHSTRSGTEPTPLYGRFISKDGVPGPTALTLTSGAYLASLFAGGGNGNNQVSWSTAAQRYLLTWTATIPTGNPLLDEALAPKQIVGRFLDADGAGIGPDFLVTNVADTFVGPHAHVRGADRWVVIGTRPTGANWDQRQIGVVTVPDSGEVSAPTFIGPVLLRAPDVAYNAALDRFLVVYTELTAGAVLTASALDRAGVPIGGPVAVGPNSVHRARVTSIGTAGYAIAYWYSQPWPDPRQVVGIRVDATGSQIGGAPTAQFPGWVTSIVQQCDTGTILMSWWTEGNPTDVYLQALDTTGLSATDCLEVSSGTGVVDGGADSASLTSWVPASGGAPQQPAGRGEWQREDGRVMPLTVSAPGDGQLRYAADGLTVTLTGRGVTSVSKGLVVDPNGAVECQVCAEFAAGNVVEVWMFSEPRLVAAHAVTDDECQTFTIPVGAPLDGGGPVSAGAHTLQLALPTSSGMQAVNVGVIVGGPLPASVPAGEGPVPSGAVLLALLGAAVVVVAGRRLVTAG
jgi:hypothetical protein